jgi:hypothetical protein
MQRREFIGAIAALGLNGEAPRRILVDCPDQTTFKRRLAAREMLRGLTRLGMGCEIRPGGPGENAATGDRLVSLRIEPARFKTPESYSISASGFNAVLAAPNEQALLYAVFDFLERQGALFGIDGESYPLQAARDLVLPAAGRPWTAAPRFPVRGLLPWPDFLNCISVYNEDDFRAYFEAMLRMRFNTFGMHVYAQASQWAESYLSFEYAGVGHLAFLDTTATNRWGYLPQRTSRYGMGAAQFYDGEVFGSDATRLARDPWDAAARTRAMLQRAFAHAARLGIRTGIGFEPYQIPDEILRALPPEAVAPPPTAGARRRAPRFNIESVTARDMLETRLGQLLEAYPDVHYVWLWEDEDMNWASRDAGAAAELSVTPFRQAYDFLKRHAPKKRMVLSGWGGVARNFAAFHERLPEDIIFACLSDSLGWDPVHEVFGKLSGRERWPIPWLEDDPGMWLPQFHVNRFYKDMNLAVDYGCQGLLGIHWRHRIVDPTAAFQSRFSWDAALSPADYYRAYARTQASPSRAARLAETLHDADLHHRLLSTYSGQVKDGHAVTVAWSGDYNEAFTYWKPQEPPPQVVESQKEVAVALRALVAEAPSAVEKERLDYLAGHVEMLAPFAESWKLAHALHRVLEAAAELRKSARAEDARAKVAAEAVPLYGRLAAEVRAVMLRFQSVVANRNDLGTLASMHNKFVRLALVRLRLSMREYLGELPPATETAFAEAVRSDPKAPARIFIPTRPTMIERNARASVRIVVTGGTGEVALRTRTPGGAWKSTPARLVARRTYEAPLGPFAPDQPLAEYQAAAGSLATGIYAVTLL